MELVKDTNLEVGWLTWPARPAAPAMTVVVKATFTLASGTLALAPRQEVVSGERWVDDDLEKALTRDTDLAPFKPCGECLVVGSCHPPGGEATRAQIAFQVGNIRKNVAVIGDRTWSLRGATEPRPFRSMPLTWDRAFGGPGHAQNPVGRGLQKVGDAVPLPNLEDPQALIQSAGDRPTPVCAAPISRTWPSRMRLAGTYDGAWLAQRYPGFAEDLAWEYFLGAPPDQRIAGYFAGDEELVLVNLVEGTPSLRAHLPGLTPRAFLTPKGAPDPAAQLWELVLRLDTIVVDGDARTVSCVWRGVTDVATESLAEMGQLFVTVDAPGRKRSVAECGAALRAELEKRREAEAAHEPEAPPEVASGPLFKTMMGAELKWAHLDQALTVQAGGAPPALMRELAEKLRARGVSLDPSTPLGRTFASLGRGEAREEAAPELDYGELRALEERLLEEERARLRGVGLDLRRRVQRALMDGESCANWDLTGVDLSRLNISGGDFKGARFVRANLAGAIFGGASFEGAVFHEAELSDASFHGASLDGASITLSRLERAHFGDSTLDHATFAECFLREARFTRSYARHAEIADSHLEDITFDDCVFDGADFSGSTLERALFARTSLVDAWMPDGMTVRRVRFDRCDLSLLRAAGGTDLSGSTFAACVANGARFGGSIGRGTDFSFSELSRADFAEAELAGAKLMACRLEKARFDGAKLHGASLVRSNLFHARFEGADLREADLRGASLYQAELFRARLDGAKLELANVDGTRIAR